MLIIGQKILDLGAISEDIIPENNNSYDLGSSSKTFALGYLNLCIFNRLSRSSRPLSFNILNPSSNMFKEAL